MCAPVTGASSVPLYGAVLGFGSSTAAYPALDADFGSAPPPNAIVDKGIVSQTLGGDGLPVYAAGVDGSATTTGPAAFPAWFGGAPASPSAVDASVVLRPSGGTLAYSSSAYFPLDQDSEDLFTVVFQASRCLCTRRRFNGLMDCVRNNSAGYLQRSTTVGACSIHRALCLWQCACAWRTTACALQTSVLLIHDSVTQARFTLDQTGYSVSVTGNDDTWVFVDGRLLLDLGGLGVQTGALPLAVIVAVVISDPSDLSGPCDNANTQHTAAQRPAAAHDGMKHVLCAGSQRCHKHR